MKNTEFANKLLIHVICNITFYLLFALRFYGYYTTADPTTTPAGDILTSISQKYNTTIATFYLFVHTFSISNRKSKSYDNAKCIIWRKNISLYCGTIFHKKSQTRQLKNTKDHFYWLFVLLFVERPLSYILEGCRF